MEHKLGVHTFLIEPLLENTGGQWTGVHCVRVLNLEIDENPHVLEIMHIVPHVFIILSLNFGVDFV